MVMTAGWITLICGLLVAVVTLVIGLNAGTPRENGAATVYRWRPYYFVVLLTAVILGLVVFLPQTPYAAPSARAADVEVNVVGKMWSWEIKGAEPGRLVLPAKKLIEFAVTSLDVNHGFGLYDDSGALVAQTQAMPGYTNRLRHVFDQPGKYHVLCLEYCGLAHQVMMTEFEVQ